MLINDLVIASIWLNQRICCLIHFISNRKFMSVNVLFLPDRITVPAQAGEPLLDVAARAGVSITTVCKVGACQSCRVKIAGQELPVRACLEKVSDVSMSIIHLLNN